MHFNVKLLMVMIRERRGDGRGGVKWVVRVGKQTDRKKGKRVIEEGNL